MQKSTRKIIYALVIILVLALVGWYLFEKNIGTVNIPDKAPEIVDEVPIGSSTSSLPGFTLPDGFSMSIFARDLPGARTIYGVGEGFLVAQTSEGKVTFIADKDGDGVAEFKKTILENLKRPHGIEIGGCEVDCFLYVAEQDKLAIYYYFLDTQEAKFEEKLLDLPSSITDRHFTRSLLFLPPEESKVDNHGLSSKLLISVGSSCDVCHEENEEYGSILSYNVDTGKKEVYAKGLRNAVFMALDYVHGRVYATEMGRDNLGDNLPPDEINIIEKGKHYGWPTCYGKNILDTNFDKNINIDSCLPPYQTPSFIDLPAHSAPLGLAFIPEEGWPEEYWYNLLVAYHGSWNRSEPTGYKIARIKINAKGEYLGTEDFITGWLNKDGKKTGRPVDITIYPGGTAYITDDSAGVVYKVWRNKEI